VICARLAEALRRGDAVHEALGAAALSLPVPYPGRIAHCLERLDSGDEPLIACLRAEWLFPARLEREGLAAEALGREAFADWLADRSGDLGSPQWTMLAAAMPTAVVTCAVTTYVIVGVLPKELCVLQSMHLNLPFPLQP